MRSSRLVDVASRLTIGGPAAEPAPFMGPVVSAVAKRLVQAQADMVAKGGKLLLEMRQLDENTGFVTAGIVDVTDAKGIPDEEWFGPLLQVIRVADFDSAIKAANATEFGLAAALISNDETCGRSSRCAPAPASSTGTVRPPALPAPRRSAAWASRATTVLAPTTRPTTAPIRSLRSKTMYSKCRRSCRRA
jgi:acyl-CoA reductase-like NAD-dependent aldehyde dehydrogenase